VRASLSLSVDIGGYCGLGCGEELRGWACPRAGE
jgi:hypothetical protein